MSFLLKNVEKKFELFSETRLTPSPVFVSESEDNILAGEIWNTTYEEIFRSNWEDDPKLLNKYNGCFSIVSIRDHVCTFAGGG